MASLKDIPWIGDTLYDIRQAIHGNPDAIKAAYDQQIQASQAAQAQMQQFLMGKKGEAQAIYAPMQRMFQKTYGEEGIRAPQTPQLPQGQLTRYAGK